MPYWGIFAPLGMTNLPKTIEDLLVVSLTPQNLERGDLWFSENTEAIKKAQKYHSWWRENSLLLEKDLVIKPSELSRKFLDLGYERASHVRGRGLFAGHGGILEIWPVNCAKPCLIEFSGNVISRIEERAESKEYLKLKPLLGDTIEKILPGGYVVHQDHGIGMLRGVQKDQRTGIDFYLVEYAAPREGAEPDKLFVPQDQKERLTPYVGFETPRLHRLGGNLWEKTKRKTKEDAEKFARELISIYAKRFLAEREPYQGDSSLEDTLRQSFAFQETADQLKAEQEILNDLEKKTPMDRVLCGDVGFGKTEIAIRAAARVITSGRQVALLAPTTILAFQHEKTFRLRLADLPITISSLSRLTPSKEAKNTLHDLKEGKIDCLIGTHRLLSKDIKFKNLGLAIIDEEQRFGVWQKEKLKELRAEMDILSLSATPIPRTMQFIISCLRAISLITTPPPERQPIQTLVLPYSGKLIKEAIRFEIERGGQVYFLHNRIETLGQVKKKLEKYTAFARGKIQIAVLHGRLPEKEIMRNMEKFRNHEAQILLATTIIENGLDISAANTLIVDDATRLGLAEAHQLRGRIGRGAERAFAFFLYKPKFLTEKAGERLEALKEYAELGAGYQIALRDLEIRGAGNILGREQSGAINRVGLNLYYQILNEAIAEEKQKEKIEDKIC